MPGTAIDHDLVERVIPTRLRSNLHGASFIPYLREHLVQLRDQGLQLLQIIGSLVDVVA